MVTVMVFAAVILGGGLAATPAFADPSPSVHVCKDVGDVDNIEGIFCTDLLTTTINGTEYVGLRIQAFCENLNTLEDVQCSNVVAYGGTFNTAIAASNPDYQWSEVCGHANGACSTGRNYFGPYSYVPAGCNIWGVIFNSNSAGDTHLSYITLPYSNQNVYLSGNFSSGHYNYGSCS